MAVNKYDLISRVGSAACTTIVCRDFPHCPWCQERVTKSRADQTPFTEHPPIPKVFMLTAGEARMLLADRNRPLLAASNEDLGQLLERMRAHVDTNDDTTTKTTNGDDT